MKLQLTKRDIERLADPAASVFQMPKAVRFFEGVKVGGTLRGFTEIKPAPVRHW